MLFSVRGGKGLLLIFSPSGEMVLMCYLIDCTMVTIELLTGIYGKDHNGNSLVRFARSI